MKRKAVHFDTPPPSSSQVSSGVLSLPSPAPSSYPTTMGSITNICAAMRDSGRSGSGIGFLVDESLSLHRHDIYIVNEQFQPGASAQTLDRLLYTARQQGSTYKLSRGDRLYIAVTLASSLLQLHGTSWLKRRWKSGDILLIPSEDQTQRTMRNTYVQPYLPWKTVPDDEVSAMSPSSEQPGVSRQIRNESVFALGCVLIELSLKQNLHDRRLQEDTHSIEAVTDFNTALRLVDEVYGESGTRYGDVVDRCLNCPFNLRDLRNFSLDNEEFHQAVFEYIYTPLRQDYEDFTGSQSIR